MVMVSWYHESKPRGSDRGATGEQGPKGDNGDKGDKGDPGRDAVAPPATKKK